MQIESYIVLSGVVGEFGRTANGRPYRGGYGSFAALRMTEETW